MLLEENKAKLKENDREKSRMKGTRAEVGIQKNNISKKIQELQENLFSEKAKLQDLMVISETDTSQNLAEQLKLKNQQKNKLEDKREVIQAQQSATRIELETVKDVRDRKAKELTTLKDKWFTFDSELTKMNVLYVSKCKEITNQENIVEKLTEDLQNWERKREAALQEHKKAKVRA